MSDSTDPLESILDNAPVAFGLAAQGHLPTIERMLHDGRTWAEIAAKIGWTRCAARSHYELHVGDRATRKSRYSLAFAVETLRDLSERHGHEWNANERNDAASAWLTAEDHLTPCNEFFNGKSRRTVPS